MVLITALKYVLGAETSFGSVIVILMRVNFGD